MTQLSPDPLNTNAPPRLYLLPSLARPVMSSGRMVLSREQGLLWQVE